MPLITKSEIEDKAFADAPKIPIALKNATGHVFRSTQKDQDGNTIWYFQCEDRGCNHCMVNDDHTIRSHISKHHPVNGQSAYERKKNSGPVNCKYCLLTLKNELCYESHLPRSHKEDYLQEQKTALEEKAAKKEKAAEEKKAAKEAKKAAKEKKKAAKEKKASLKN